MTKAGRSGQSLVGILIATALMGIIIMIVASIFEYQNREVRGISEKLGSADLERTLITALSDGSVCQYVLNNPTVLTFDSTNVTPSTPQAINITGPLYASIKAGTPPTPGPVIAQIGQAPSAYSNSLVVSSIALSITAGSGGIFMGNWLVSFDSSKTVRPIKAASVSTTLTVDATNPTAATITKCQGAGVGTLTGRSYSENNSMLTIGAIIPMVDVIPNNTQGTQILAVTHVQKNVGDILRVTVNVPGSMDSVSSMLAALFQDANPTALASAMTTPGTNMVDTLHLVYETTASSTGPTTFRVRVGPQSGTMTVNGAFGARFLGGSARATVTVDEYSP